MKRATGDSRRRRGAVALNLALVMAAGSIVGYAVSARGYDAHRPDLNDGGIWVTDSQLSSFGRINKPIGQLDAIIYSDAHSDVDVLQQDSAVLGENLTARRLTVLDPATGSPVDGRDVSVPRGAQVQLGGGTVASLDPVKGSVWVTRVATAGELPDLTAIDAEAAPMTEAGGNAGLTVTQRGTVVVASADDDTLTRIARAGSAVAGSGMKAPTTADLPLQGTPAVTAVGETVVVLDQETGALTVVGGARAVVDVGSVLQQPGPAADTVLLETPTALMSVDLETGAPETVATVPSGTPTAPVRLGACEFGAWSGGRGYVTTRCGTDDAATVALDHHTSDLVFRVNRGQILLNDRLSGSVWNIDETPTKIDNWEAFRNPNADNDKASEEQNDNPGDRRPPRARNDEFGARPGRTTVTHPLDNDSAPAGRMLAVSSVEQLSGQAAPATISPDGQTVQFQQPANASGSATYAYYISDGRHAVGAHAKITLEVRKRGNEQPRLRDGFTPTTWPVAPGGTVTLPVLTDWRDPADGDALDVVEASVASGGGDGAGVQTTTDGRVRFTAPNRPGPVKLTYGVSDGRSAPVAHNLAFRVQDPDVDEAVAAVAQPDIVTAEAGQWVTIRPLANDLPGADPLTPDAQLALAGAVTGPKGAQARTDLSQGTVSFRAAEAASYFLDYEASYGEAPLASGRIRVDVHQRERRGPVAMPDTATIYGPSSTLVDVLANDNDPRGGVLMVQSAKALSEQIDVAVVDGRWVRVSARAGELRPRAQVVRYVVSNGAQTAVGEIQVTQRGVPEDDAPVTQPDQVTVRAGTSATIPVLDNDFSPSGDQLSLVGDLDGQSPGRLPVTGVDGKQRGTGEAYVSGRLVRFVAPPTVETAETMTVTYVAQNARGQSSPGAVEVTVVPEGKHNQLPAAPILEGRVVAGGTITLHLPGVGVDPDGDSVTMMGIASAPSFGRVDEVGANTISYQAYPASTGTDEFDYVVEDSRGGRARGTARIVVVQPGPIQPPLAIPDELTVEPGREATILPLANDFIGPEDRVSLELVDPPAGVTLAGDTGPVTVETAGLEEGRTITAVYRLSNGVDTTQSTITVHTAAPYNNPPVVFDAFGPATDSPAVRVDVLQGAYDPDGPTRGLRITKVYADDARIVGDRVTVLRSEEPRVVAFRVEDADGGSAIADLYVPPTGSGLPFVKPNTLIKLQPGEQKRFTLASYVVNPSGEPMRLATGTQLFGSPPGLVTAASAGQDAFTVSAADAYRGPGAVLLEVTAPGFREPVVLSVPVQVGDQAPVLHCPTQPITVPRGGERALDITRLCRTFTSNPDELAALSYTAEWVDDVDGLSLVTDQGREIVVAASGSARSGAEATLEVVTEGSKPGRIRVQVAAATAPTLAPMRITDLRAGEARTVDLAQYLDTQLPDARPTIVSVTPVNGSGVTASRASDTGLRLTASAKANGVATFRVTMSDVAATDQVERQASNLLTVELLGVPGTPSAPVPSATLRSEAVRLSWKAPDANGARIDRYEVVGSNKKTYRCATTACDITGLANGTSYTFKVRAHNAVGWSELSPASKPATPNGVPGVVTKVHAVKISDGFIWIGWSPPDKNGAGIDSYRVTFQGKKTVTKQPSFIANHLDNNKRYTFTIEAHNAAGYGTPLKTQEFQSAGDPNKPNPPTWQDISGPTSSTATIRVNWDQVLPGSEAEVRYTVSDRGVQVAESSCVGTLGYSCTISGIPYDGRAHQFKVEASTEYGSKISDYSTTWAAVAPPLPWGSWSVRPTGADGKAQATFTVPESRGEKSLVTILVDGAEALGPVQMTGNQQRTVTVADNDGPHAVALKVCNEVADNCRLSNAQMVQTYGPLQASMLKVTPTVGGGGTTLDWEISIDPNGAPVDLVVRSNKRPTRSWRVNAVDTQVFNLGELNLGFSTTETLTVSVVDNARDRQLPVRTVSKTTPDPPPALVKVGRGDKCDDAGANPCDPSGQAPPCTDASCGFITVEVHNFFGPVTCTLTAKGDGMLGTIDVADESTTQTPYYFGVPGDWVQASCTGPGNRQQTDRFVWPN